MCRALVRIDLDDDLGAGVQQMLAAADPPPVTDEAKPTRPPANDEAQAEPAPPAGKSAIVTRASRKRSKLLRPELPDDPEADAALPA